MSGTTPCFLLGMTWREQRSTLLCTWYIGCYQYDRFFPEFLQQLSRPAGMVCFSSIFALCVLFFRNVSLVPVAMLWKAVTCVTVLCYILYTMQTFDLVQCTPCLTSFWCIINAQSLQWQCVAVCRWGWWGCYVTSCNSLTLNQKTCLLSL